MSLNADLEKLQRQKREEIRTLHQTYLRTKRTVVRNASPARILRRNMGLSLSVAALLGILLAPRPGAAKSAENGHAATSTAGKFSSMFGIKKLLARFMPHAAEYIPDAPTSEPAVDHEVPQDAPQPTAADAKKKRGAASKGIIGLIMKELAAIALSKIDFQKLMAQAMTQFTQRSKPDHTGDQPDHPHVSVANAGTIEPDAYNDFT